jgi:hypothetical protein
MDQTKNDLLVHTRADVLVTRNARLIGRIDLRVRRRCL